MHIELNRRTSKEEERVESLRVVTSHRRGWPAAGHRCELVYYYRGKEEYPYAVEASHYLASGWLNFHEMFSSKTRAEKRIQLLWGEYNETEEKIEAG